MWLQGFDIDRATGRLYLAVGAYGAATDGRPRGTIRVGHSDDGGVTWSFARLPRRAAMSPAAASRASGRTSSPVPGYVLVTFHTIDDVAARATVGNAYTISTDGGATWRTPEPVSSDALAAANLGGVINGIGLRERAEMLADGDVFWAYGDGGSPRVGGRAGSRSSAPGSTPASGRQAVWR